MATLMEKVLIILEESQGQPVSGSKIGSLSGVSRTAVWKAVGGLRAAGYAITGGSGVGYALGGRPDILSAAAIAARSMAFGEASIYCLKTVDSTNTYAKQLASAGINGPCLVVADNQTNGRGRRGRSFFSPAGSGIYMSLLFQPDFHISESSLITAAAAVAVTRAIKNTTGLDCFIKWVNDIYVKTDPQKTNYRKVCGILTEGITDLETGQIQHIVLGVGINFSSPSAPFPDAIKETAGSLFPGPASCTRNDLVGELADQLSLVISDMETKYFLTDYRQRSFILGQPITVSSANGVFDGTAIDIDASGNLIVKDEAGNLSVLASGEVTILPDTLKG